MHCGAILGRKGRTGGDGWIQARVTKHMVTVAGQGPFLFFTVHEKMSNCTGDTQKVNAW